MKKFFISVAVATVALFSANAQELKFGVKAGVNFATLSIPEYTQSGANVKIETGFRTGFHVGAFVEYGVSDVLFLEGGLAYNNVGGTLKSAEISSPIGKRKIDYKDTSFVLHTLNMPLWVKYDIAGFRPKAGINLGGLLAVTEKQDGKSETLEPEKRFDLGLGIGAEYNLPMGLFFDATFNLGLLNLATENSATSIKNRVIQIGVGYKF